MNQSKSGKNVKSPGDKLGKMCLFTIGVSLIERKVKEKKECTGKGMV